MRNVRRHTNVADRKALVNRLSDRARTGVSRAQAAEELGIPYHLVLRIAGDHKIRFQDAIPKRELGEPDIDGIIAAAVNKLRTKYKPVCNMHTHQRPWSYPGAYHSNALFQVGEIADVTVSTLLEMASAT